MRFLVIVLVLFPFSAFSDVVGTWAWNAAGCRDSSLSPDSHSSRSKSDGQQGVEASILELNSDESASMMIEFNDKTKNETGTYTLKDDKVSITDPNINKNAPILVLHVVGDDELVIKEEDIEGQSNASCKDGYYFVYVFGRV